MSKTITDPQQEKSLRGWLSTDTVVDGIRSALAGTIDEDQFLSQMLIAFQRPDIVLCTEKSKFEAVHTCASYGLLPHLHQVALIPRDISGGKKTAFSCDVMVQWQGYKALMERHPGVSEVLCFLVHRSDQFQFMATENIVVHEYDPFDENRKWDKDLTELRGGYLKIIFNDARGVRYHFLNREEILKRKRCAQTSKIWDAWPKEQAMKSVYRDAYARQVVPVDPLCQTRIERVMSDEDTLLGNDPSRVYEQPAPRIASSPSRAQQALERLRENSTVEPAHEAPEADVPEPDVTTDETTEAAEPAKTTKGKAKAKESKATPPPDMPDKLKDYTNDIHRCTKKAEVAVVWNKWTASGMLEEIEDFDCAIALRDWKLNAMGVEDVDAFMAEHSAEN